jgi:hypothetical protein
MTCMIFMLKWQSWGDSNGGTTPTTTNWATIVTFILGTIDGGTRTNNAWFRPLVIMLTQSRPWLPKRQGLDMNLGLQISDKGISL